MRRYFAYPYCVWLAVFVLAPLLLIAYYAFTGTAEDGSTYFTLQHARSFFVPRDGGGGATVYVRIALHSLQLALYSTALCFLFGYPLAYILAGRGFSGKSFLLFLFIAPMWMNFLVRTYAWLTILERNGLLNALLGFFGLPGVDILFTDTAVLLGMVYNFLPFMVLPIYTSLIKMDRRVIEAAQDLGANPANVFFRVVFPLSMPGVVSGITMVFMPSAATFIIPNLLGGRQYFLLGNLVEQRFITFQDWGFGSMVAVVMMGLMLASTLLLSLFDKQETMEGGRLI